MVSVVSIAIGPLSGLIVMNQERRVVHRHECSQQPMPVTLTAGFLHRQQQKHGRENAGKNQEPSEGVDGESLCPARDSAGRTRIARKFCFLP